MSRWEKRTLRLPENHGWTARDGYQVFVADRGAVRLDFPQGWIVKPREGGSICFHDREPPDDRCVIEMSYLRLRPIDWSGLPIVELLKAAADQHGYEDPDERIVQVTRPDLELAWTEHRKMDPAELRPAIHRMCIARSVNAVLPHPRRQGAPIATRPVIQALITAACWPEDLGWFEPAWDEVLRSLQLGTTVASPFGPTRS